MQIRTDLALEQQEQLGRRIPGVQVDELKLGDVVITRIRVADEEGEKALGRKMGNYVTVEVPPFSDEGGFDPDTISAIKSELLRLLPEQGLILIAGLGNTEITPDAIGPKTVDGILATRHITGELARTAGLSDLRPVAAVSPGVLGQTGIETGEIIAGIVDRVKPAAVVVIDALASRKLSRLGCTIQMTDTGLHPGSGVGNRRAEISSETLGIPVVALGVPTVVDAATLVYDLTGANPETLPDLEPRGAKMIVTPREIDLLVERASALIAHSLNCALQPTLSSEELLELKA